MLFCDSEFLLNERYTLKWLKWDTLKKKITNVGKDVEKLELLYTVGGL